MKFKIITCLACCASVFCLTGCDDQLSGDSYTRAEAKQVSSVQYGTVVSKREVLIKRHDGAGAGAVVGTATGALTGGLIGNAISSGTTGKIVGAGIGALAGGVTGNAIQNRSVKGYEYTVGLDNGGFLAITQGKTPELLVGQRVQVLSNASGGRIIPA